MTLQCKDNAGSVMSSINLSSAYSVMPYKQFKAFQTSVGSGVPAPKPKLPAPNTTGITPVLESSKFSFDTFLATNKLELPNVDKIDILSPEKEAAKKRSASPEFDTFKRTKSVNEEAEIACSDSGKKKDPFEVPSWD